MVPIVLGSEPSYFCIVEKTSGWKSKFLTRYQRIRANRSDKPWLGPQTMTRFQLLDRLNSIHTAFHLANLGSTLMLTDEARPIIAQVTIDYGRFHIDFAQFQNEPREKLGESIYELGKAVTRQLITETFEQIKAYTEQSSQTSAFKGQAWYQFARFIRNAYNHDFHFHFRSHDHRHFPVEYSTHANPPEVLRIDASMDGIPIDIVNRPSQQGRRFFQFTYEHALDLFYEMQKFAKSLN